MQQSTSLAAASTATTDADKPPFKLGYASDVEGNLEYFQRYIARSDVLDFANDDAKHRRTKDLQLRLRDGCMFVYGGDVVDKGPGDIRVCRALVALKKAHPDRVFLIVGNRDLNKVRFTAELSEADMQRDVHSIPGMHWLPGHTTLGQYLDGKLSRLHQEEEQVEAALLASMEPASVTQGQDEGEAIPDLGDEMATDTPSNDNSTPNKEAQGSTQVQLPPRSTIKDVDTRVARLQYMLDFTLGCGGTFEFRREELGILQGRSRRTITDDEVLHSFLHEMEHPEGSLRQYMELANVVVRIGNTLFCHGAIDRQTMQFVPAFDSKFHNPPSKPQPGQVCTDVDEWVDQLNAYLRHGFQDYLDRPHWNANRTSRGGESLMALQNRPAMWGRSIVSNSYADGGCITTTYAASVRNDPKRVALEEHDPLVFESVNSDPMDADVAEWLSTQGVQRIVVGHKPTGDCPSVLSSLHTGVEVVSADTSYSDDSCRDNRGKAVPVIEVSGRSASNNALRLSGVLKDGSQYDCQFLTLRSGEEDEIPSNDGDIGDNKLGRRLMNSDGSFSEWWVQVSSTNLAPSASSDNVAAVNGDGDGMEVEDSGSPRNVSDEGRQLKDGFYLLCRGAGRKFETKQVPVNAVDDAMHVPWLDEVKVKTIEEPDKAIATS